MVAVIAALIVALYRFLSGRPLDGRPDHPYLTPGDGRWPGWKRQVARLLPLVAWTAAAINPQATKTAAAAVGVVALYVGRRWWRRRRFRREYVTPTLAALRNGMGVEAVELHVDPNLGNLTPRLAKPLSPAETSVRRVYGQRVEPVWRRPIDLLMAAVWSVQKTASPVTSKLAAFKRPVEKPGPRIHLDVDAPYLTDEQRKLASAVIHAKVPVADLVESWHQVGPRVTATWTVRKRPPMKAGLDELRAVFPQLDEWEFYVGPGPGNAPVTLSLHDDSPHVAISAGSGAGKSVLAQLIAVQVLARGGLVVILDRKGSHRWARNMPGIDYCSRPDQMHNALLRLASVSVERNDLSFHEEDGWDPGQRIFVICEELNATIGQLTNYWAQVRDKSDPKRSPAVSALAELLFMGRSAKVNVLAIAQMLTARAIGGPEARENFGIRFLARYTVNAWKMLVPEAAMPRASRVLGRWQMVIGGVSTEVQVAFLTPAQARAFAGVPANAKVPDSPLTSNVPGDRGHERLVTLREAVDEGVLPWTYDAAKKRMQRRVGEPPKACGKRGTADLYRHADLYEWSH